MKKIVLIQELIKDDAYLTRAIIDDSSSEPAQVLSLTDTLALCQDEDSIYLFPSPLKVTLHQLDLGNIKKSQLAKVIFWELEELTPFDTQALHFVYQADNESAITTVATIPKDLLSETLQPFISNNISITSCIAPHFLLAHSNESDANTLLIDDIAIYTAQQEYLIADTVSLEEHLHSLELPNSIAINSIWDDSLEQQTIKNTLHYIKEAPNFLTGVFRPKSQQAIYRTLIKHLAMASLVILTSYTLGTAYQVQKLQKMELEQRQNIQETFASIFPNIRVRDPVKYTENQLESIKAQHNDTGFIILLSKVTKALQPTKTKLQSITYNQNNGEVIIEALLHSFSDIDKIKNYASQYQLNNTLLGSSQEGEKIKVRFQFSEKAQ